MREEDYGLDGKKKAAYLYLGKKHHESVSCCKTVNGGHELLKKIREKMLDNKIRMCAVDNITYWI